MKVRGWFSSDTDKLLQWAENDVAVMEALGVPDDKTLAQWLELTVPLRAAVVKDDGSVVALVGMTPVYMPHIFVSPDQRKGRNTLVAAERALSLAKEGGASIVIATPRRDNESSVKLCRALGLEPRPDHVLYIGVL